MDAMALRLSVIMPTIGRPSLATAMATVATQLRASDELIVVQDLQHDAESMFALADTADYFSDGDIRFASCLDERSRFGNAQRDYALKLAQGSHVCFLDDDDIYRPGTLDLFHQAIEAAAHAVHVFRAEWGPGHHAAGTVLWRERAFVEQNVATPMVVYPNQRLPRWMDSNDRGIVSDFGWMSAALGNRRVVWHEEIVATVRP